MISVFGYYYLAFYLAKTFYAFYEHVMKRKDGWEIHKYA